MTSGNKVGFESKKQGRCFKMREGERGRGRGKKQEGGREQSIWTWEQLLFHSLIEF